MKTYDRHARCPKCACRNVGTKYDRSPYTWAGDDALLRWCRRCDYEWKEVPLDAAGMEAP